VKERPIMFSGPMVRALLSGRKTQTRRLFKWKGGHAGLDSMCPRSTNEFVDVVFRELEKNCPYGKPGDRLWVRETWLDRCTDPHVAEIEYRADCVGFMPDWKWKPSIFMPKIYSRLTLEVTAVRCERLQDISPDDARAEGCGTDEIPWKAFPALHDNPWVATYASLWDSINGAGSWASNPWVWVISFCKI